MTDTVRVPVDLFGEYDHMLEVRHSSIPEVEAGDYAAVRKATAVGPGRVAVARNVAGDYSLRRAPVGDGWTVEGVVVGVWRSFE